MDFSKKGQIRVWLLAILWVRLFAASARGATNAPALELTSIPPFGSTNNLLRRVLNVNPADFRVAVYIYVGGSPNDADLVAERQGDGSRGLQSTDKKGKSNASRSDG